MSRQVDASTFPYSPFTETGLAIQINDRASALTYAIGAGRAMDPTVVAEAGRVYAMCRAHTDRILAILHTGSGVAA